MLTLYLSCLVVGGVFVGLSALGALGKDVGTNLDADADAGLALGDGPALHGQALALADASHGLAPRKRKLWLPVLSFRFWTFGAAFFGLMGTLLTTLTAAGVLFVAATSTATGLGIGTLSAWMVRWLRRPVGATIRLADYSGCAGELMLPLREGGVTRIRIRVQERERTMLAVSTERVALPTGTKVFVLGIDKNGRAQIEPENTIYPTEE